MINVPFKDIAERALSSAGEQFLSVILLGGAVLSLAGLPWKVALATSAGAFLISILLSLAQFSVGLQSLSFWPDTAIRLVKTFAASLLGSLGSGVIDVTSVPWKDALNLAAVATFIALVKCVLAATTHRTGASLIQNVDAAPVA